MKLKLHIITYGLAALVAAALGTLPLAAGAQQPDPYYNNQQPAPQQEVDSNYQYDDGQQQQDVDINTFQDALNPYGTWEADPNYGQVWVCNDPDFIPYYSGGSWAYSDAGWAWNSTYAWGWAPFHYGRWAYTNRWMWVPGYEWAPAWVAWRTGGDYYGWAPLGPGINIGAGVGYGGYYPAARWNFCPRAYITSANFAGYVVNRSENITIIRNTTVINTVNVYHNASFIAGPERTEVERYTGAHINTVAIRNASAPGATRINGNEFNVYRPNVRANASGPYNRNYTNNAQPSNAPRQSNAGAAYGQQDYNRQQYQPQQRQAQPASPQPQPQQRPAEQPARPQAQPQQQSRERQYNPSRPAPQPVPAKPGSSGAGRR